MSGKYFSFTRMFAVMRKEFIQLRRDRTTMGMILFIPLMQLVMFGYAINTDPKHLPTAVIARDHSPFARSLVASLEKTDYFSIDRSITSEEEARKLLQQGRVQFVVTIPEGFGRDIVRGERPRVVIEADATDPIASAGAISAANGMLETAFDHDLTGTLSHLNAKPGPIEIAVHRKYNPEGFSRYNIVPGLMGIVLTLTGIMMTALALTRERERGTMENLLATPVRPAEVMVGKILPYVLIGYIQLTVIMTAAFIIFDVPMVGSLPLLLSLIGIFIMANLAVGFTFSTIAKNQLQAMQMTFFFFLPSILLSGFMFPFRAMPVWAQNIGEVLPLTHFLRIVRGILLKGNSVDQLAQELWPMLAFLFVAGFIALKRYRQTLD